MFKIVNLGRTGLYVVTRGGALTTLGGRSFWDNAEQAREAAKREDAAVCDRVLTTLL